MEKNSTRWRILVAIDRLKRRVQWLGRLSWCVCVITNRKSQGQLLNKCVPRITEASGEGEARSGGAIKTTSCSLARAFSENFMDFVSGTLAAPVSRAFGGCT